MNAYWYRKEKNFGDLLTPYIAEKLYGRKLEYAEPRDAELFGCGSILESVPRGYRGCVLGSGFINRGVYKDLRHAKVLLLRGRQTKAYCDLSGACRLGDPGVLLSMFAAKGKKDAELGIIPHYCDKDNQDIALWRNGHEEGSDYIVIDVQQEPETVIQQVARCKTVVSSSLHGLILADALGIPNKWVKWSDLKGGTFKFEDYYSNYRQFPTPATSIYKALSKLDVQNTAHVEQNVKEAFDELFG